MEECKVLKENPLYSIYNDGRLQNNKTGRFLKGKVDNIGYLSYSIKKLDGKNIYPYAHRLVVTYFIKNPDNLPVVNHINENRLDNRVENLEWVTYKVNTNKYLNNNKKLVKEAEYYTSNLPNEIWKTIKDFPNYMVSSYGRIVNSKTKRIMKTDKSHTYERITLYNQETKIKKT